MTHHISIDPLIPFGRLVLNKNPTNYFAEVEQAAFSPANLVPGIEPSPDKMLQGRLFSYNDTQRHRLGPNYAQIPINCPLRSNLNTYQRDGLMAVNGNGGNKPNYEPNSLGGYVESKQLDEHPIAYRGVICRSPHLHSNDHFTQPRALYRKVMSDTDRAHLVKNLVSHLKNAKKEIQARQLNLFYKVDEELGDRIAKGLGLSKY